LDRRFAGSKPAEDDEFLREIKIHSTPSFGGELKPPNPYRKFLRHVKESYAYETDTSWAKFNGHVFAMFILFR
jgi:hypothetical protein